MKTIRSYCRWVENAWKFAPKEVTEKDEILFLIEEIGELAEAIRKKKGNKESKTANFDLEKEFGDVMLSIITLALRYGIDLENAFEKTKRSVEQRYMEAKNEIQNS